MRKTSFLLSSLKCQECGNEISIPRRLDRVRKKGHIKTMYCPYCQKERDFEELGKTEIHKVRK